MRSNARTIRLHYQRETRRVESLNNGARSSVPPVDLKSHATTVNPSAAVSVRGQLSFSFYEPNRPPQLGRQARHELAIAGWIVAEKRYAPQLLAWANRRLSLERYKAKQRRHAEELRHKLESRLEACEQHRAAITRQLGMLVRKLEGLRFADTRTLVSFSSELRRLAEQCADRQRLPDVKSFEIERGNNMKLKYLSRTHGESDT